MVGVLRVNLTCKQQGYLPETIINFVAFLGWAPSQSQQEIFTLAELIEAVR